MACAGIHREHGARVKGVGHSSFTAEEAGRLRTTDNEKINLMWLARYNPRVERVKPPQDNSNQQQLKSWIRRKYVEKMWYQEAGSGGQNGGTPQGQQARQTQQPQQPQPTMVQLPPREQQPPQNDPFAQAPAPTSNDNAFPADFGSSQAQQGFANFDQQPQAQGPPAQQGQQNFANFNQQQAPPQQQDPFASFPAQNQQPPNQAAPPQAQQNFAAFPPNPSGQPGPPPPQQQDPFATFPAQTQQPPNPQTQQNFAAFPPQSPGKPVAPAQTQQPPAPSFADFNSPTRPEVGNPQPQQQNQSFQAPPSQQGPPPSLPTMDHSANPPPAAEPAKQPPKEKDGFKEGETAYYKNEGTATILKVHYDDELEPFYTIKLPSGKEKQTTDSHLHKENPLPNLLQGIMQKLNDTQIKSVYDFALATLHNKESQAGTKMNEEPPLASGSPNPVGAGDDAFAGLGPSENNTTPQTESAEVPKTDPVQNATSQPESTPPSGLGSDAFAGLGPMSAPAAMPSDNASVISQHTTMTTNNMNSQYPSMVQAESNVAQGSTQAPSGQQMNVPGGNVAPNSNQAPPQQAPGSMVPSPQQSMPAPEASGFGGIPSPMGKLISLVQRKNLTLSHYCFQRLFIFSKSFWRSSQGIIKCQHSASAAAWRKPTASTTINGTNKPESNYFAKPGGWSGNDARSGYTQWRSSRSSSFSTRTSEWPKFAKPANGCTRNAPSSEPTDESRHA